MKKGLFYYCIIFVSHFLYAQSSLIDIHYDKVNSNLKLSENLINIQEQYLMYDEYIIKKEKELENYFLTNADKKIQLLKKKKKKLVRKLKKFKKNP